MVVVTLRIVFDPRRERVPAFWLLLAGMTLMFVGDVVYLFADLGLVDMSSNGCSTCRTSLAYLVRRRLRAARRRCAGSPSRAVRLRPFDSRFRIAVVAVALLIPADPHRSRTAAAALTERVVLCALMLAMTATAVLRLVQALRAAERSESSLVFQAHHDSLTGSAQPAHDGRAPVRPSAARRRSTARTWPCSTWTSTASSSSTTRSATATGTTCWSRSRSGCATQRAGRPTSSRVSAATSS